ncbi:hypothetical protein CRI94_09565 [Longibacter salinarum]|uniref:Uncharacterized protein n=1 Tax=Longibacter salinarum TaxID=1850348 RepID=A0A2A8CXT9_9BACT|nr:hypothetical protein CRI94_09565 [Longibacter salinarum]
MLFYKLTAPAENAVHCRFGNINLKSVNYVIGMPVAINESDADRLCTAYVHMHSGALDDGILMHSGVYVSQSVEVTERNTK